MSPRDREPWRGVIAIDGPAASGKSTLARLLAGQLGLAHLDTGAFYRAAALAALRAGVDCDNEVAVTKVVSEAVIAQEEGRTRLDGEDVETEIRRPAVTAVASRVAALRAVRRVLVERQRIWVAERSGAAAVKVFLTAADEERTRRRAEEMGEVARAAEVRESLVRRDRQDTARTASPLRRMPDAVVIDTTSLGPEQVAAEVLRMVAARAVVDSREGP